jgi:hypothetical protein
MNMSTRARKWDVAVVVAEPHGDAPFEVCACATHVPAYADDVDVELEGRAWV